jgi:glycosyltransferase involved in cell wall biosynthesis
MYYPLVGGAEIAVREITDRISKTDIEFDMVTLRYDQNLPKVEQIGNVTVYRVGFSKKGPSSEDLISFPLYLIKVFYPWFAFGQAFKLSLQHRYTASWAIMSYAGFPALFLRLCRRVPFILTLQEGDSLSHITKRWRIRAISPLYALVFKKADAVQAISRFLASFARDMGAVDSIAVIPNGVTLKQFVRTFNDDELLALGTSLGAKHTTRYVVTTSRLVPKNAVDILIMSLKYVPEHVELIVVGDGPDRAMLEGLAASEKVAERVHFIGHKDISEIPRYLAISEIFIRASRSEGLGSSFIEAMAAGVPIIATGIGGITDFLKDGETGLQCKVNDPKDLAEKISMLLSDVELREKIASAGRAHVLERYDWSLISRQMIANVFNTF